MILLSQLSSLQCVRRTRAARLPYGLIQRLDVRCLLNHAYVECAIYDQEMNYHRRFESSERGPFSSLRPRVSDETAKLLVAAPRMHASAFRLFSEITKMWAAPRCSVLSYLLSNTSFLPMGATRYSASTSVLRQSLSHRAACSTSMRIRRGQR